MRLGPREFLYGKKTVIRYGLIHAKALQRPQEMFVVALLLAGLVISCAVLGWLDRV